MLLIKNKIFKSIDGLFNEELNFITAKNFDDIKKKRLSIVGMGNSISSLPFVKDSVLLDLKLEKKIKLSKNRKLIEVNGNLEAHEIHNFLIKEKLFFPSFPSYPSVTVGACIANCTHGISPRFGVMSDYIQEIKLFNPNFGIKILTKKKNKKLFNLTIGGMGLTGVILKAKLKILKLDSTYIKISQNRKFNTFIDLYRYLNNNKYAYNQNNLFLKSDKKEIFNSRVSSGNFKKKKYSIKLIKSKKISFFRFGILKIPLFRKILEITLLLKEYTSQKKLLHINEAFYPSNSRLIYFNLMPKKFVEHQTIIPHKNVKKFFKDLKNLILEFDPTITLCHLKIFSGNGEYLQFNGKGLGLTIHFVINNNFYIFYKKFLDINAKNFCKPNLYKNSLIQIHDIKKFYGKNFLKFSKEIKKINKKFFFENRLFNYNNFYKK
jgi:decaprenylphospho-beta-D-ribofuranose 2-oxidase